MENFADLYTDFLITNVKLATATSFASVLGIKHDIITQALAKSLYDSKFLWKYVKPYFHETTQSNEKVFLCFDDSIVAKPYGYESELINWHFDHKEKRKVKGVNLLTAFVDNGTMRLPCSVEFVIKDKVEINEINGKKKRVATKTKNELFREMVCSCSERLPIDYVMADSWYSSRENLKLVKEKIGCHFIMALKSNRLASLEQDGIKLKAVSIGSLQLGQQAEKVWLSGLNFPVMLTKQVFKNGDGSVGELYLACSDLSLSYEQINTLYKKRWGVEVYHKSIKQNTSIGKSPTKTVNTQKNHFILSIVAYVKLEWLKQRTNQNHHAMKERIYIEANKAAFAELQKLKKVA